MPHDVIVPKRILNASFKTNLDWPDIRFPIKIQQMYVPGCIVYNERMLPDGCFDRPAQPCQESLQKGTPVNLIELSAYLMQELTKRIETLDLVTRPIVIQCTSKCSGLKLLLELWFPVKCDLNGSEKYINKLVFKSILFPL